MPKELMSEEQTFEKKDLKKIKQETETFFEKMGFSVQIEVVSREGTLEVALKSEEPRILIGEKGRILASIQKLLKAILKRKLDRDFYFNLDINDYRKKKAQYLKEMAREMADKVALTKEEKVLTPMSAYERRIIHLELADRPNVATQSIGVEPERKVVIRPHP